MSDPSILQLDKSVRERMMELLYAKGLYRVGSYGWKGPDDYDDEFIGHAMWQTDSLPARMLDAHWQASFGHGPPPPQLSSWEQLLMESGGDFDGLMEAARLSIGLTIFQQEAARRNHYAEDSLFQTHFLSSMILLSAAADRLRDIFVAAFFHQTVEEFVASRTRISTKYIAPFHEAELRASEHPKLVHDSLVSLPALAGRIHEFRELRNGLIHQVATELGRQQRKLARGPAPVPATDDYDYEEVRASMEEAEREYSRRVSSDVDRVVSWYRLLIDTSNHVFIVEYNKRNARPR